MIGHYLFSSTQKEFSLSFLSHAFLRLNILMIHSADMNRLYILVLARFHLPAIFKAYNQIKFYKDLSQLLQISIFTLSYSYDASFFPFRTT